MRWSCMAVRRLLAGRRGRGCLAFPCAAAVVIALATFSRCPATGRVSVCHAAPWAGGPPAASLPRGEAGLTFTFRVGPAPETGTGGTSRRADEVRPGAARVLETPAAGALPLVGSDLSGHWARDAVAALAGRIDLGLGAGGRFFPERPLTRSEFIAWLGQLLIAPGGVLGTPPAESGPNPGGGADAFFRDVPTGAPYAPYLRALAAHSLVQGEGSRRFAPARPLTRLELMVMAGRLLGRAGGTPETAAAGEAVPPAAGAGGNTFPLWAKHKDSAQVPAWARAEVEAALAAGVIRGRPGGLLAPRVPATRAEAVAVLFRVGSALLRLTNAR
ncbi:MAG TPA: S-layer homology domain-containing protein [Firmicutes bacterium]|nr:S-layer homology domain-containing protein [Bacillota bacterium]